ncbi:hypothetical protein JKP88DRAFT_163158, partial [Tribonema minus]
VIIGTLFIGVCSLRLYINHFSRGHHFGFEAAAWYWHLTHVLFMVQHVLIIVQFKISSPFIKRRMPMLLILRHKSQCVNILLKKTLYAYVCCN